MTQESLTDVVQMLQHQFNDHRKDAEQKLIDLKGTLEKVDGLTHWLGHHLRVMEWIDSTLSKLTAAELKNSSAEPVSPSPSHPQEN